MKKLLLFGTLILFLVLNSCTAFKKKIQKPVTVSLIDTILPAAIVTTAQLPKYLIKYKPQQFITTFLRSFKAEANITKNILFTYNNPDADFVLTVDSFNVIEFDDTTIVNDEKSPYHGKQVILNKLECNVTLKIIDKKNKLKKIKDCFYVKYKSEKLKNNRTLTDLVLDTNKDRTVYRTKPMYDGAALSLVEDVGHNIWVQITKRISKCL